MEGRLIVVATPIGNLGDLSPRAVEALTQAELWIVEDTRVSGKLASYLGLKKPMRILNDHSASFRVEKLVQEIERASCIALLSDGGTPVVSDPGAALIDACVAKSIAVEAIPGPCAAILALSLSGFYGQRFAFLGFLGRKPKDIRSELTPYQTSPLTLVLYESVHRLDTLVSEAYQSLGARRYAICRELTKSHEQVFHAILPYRPTEEEVPRKGELTIVLEGLRKRPPI